jgi:hypothetical protein
MKTSRNQKWLLSVFTAAVLAGCGNESAFTQVQGPALTPVSEKAPIAAENKGESQGESDVNQASVSLPPLEEIPSRGDTQDSPTSNETKALEGSLTSGEAKDGSSTTPGNVVEIPTSQVKINNPAIAARAKDTKNLLENISNPANETLAFAVAIGANAHPSSPLGSVNEKGEYRAPDFVGQTAQNRVEVKAGGKTVGEIVITLIPNDSFVVADDQKTQGLVGNVFDFGREVDRLPDFSKMTPVATVVMPDVHVPLRDFSAGFPGVPNLFEWFGIRFDGQIRIDVAGQYKFVLTSDDGARLYIGSKMVVDNDGVHASETKSGKITLAKGLHPLRLDYFQGPRYHIHAQLFWVKPGTTSQELVPASNLRRPSVP